jgi:hypothetical protein
MRHQGVAMIPMDPNEIADPGGGTADGHGERRCMGGASPDDRSR